MDSVIEKQRRLHEECERLETAVTKELSDKTRTHKEKILKESRIAHYLDLIFEKSTELLAIYADKSGERQADIDSLRVGVDLDEFYRNLRAVKDNYKINPEAPANMVQVAIKGTDKQRHAQDIESKFTGEENFGRTLDLNELHTMYINLKGVEHVDYLTFLDTFDKVDQIPQQTRNSGAYKTYVDVLLSYLRSFITKSQPLLNFSEIENESMQEFETTFSAITNDSSEELFCEACCRTFAKQTVFDSHLNGKKHKAAASKLNEQEVEIEKLKAEKLKEQENRNRSLQKAQHLIGKFVELLAAEIQETKEAVERKQTLTLEEFEARGFEDKEEDIIVQNESEEEEDDQKEEKFYNPLKLPIGWDGKPIPFWLYKLHGLGKEFPCEICGNFVYMGRKAFEKHFMEWRHAHGMKCLQIPNTIEFNEITSIKDALALWEKIKARRKAESAQNEMLEEFEDAYGNVYNKKTYEDLKRQGIL